MTENIKNKFNELMKEIIIHEFVNSDVVSLMLPTTDNWENGPLPEHVLGSAYMRIDIKQWSKEESFYDDRGINIVLAFGHTENSKFFSWNEIKAVIAPDNTIMIMKPYDTVKVIEVPAELSLKDVMHDEKGQKKSMESLLKKNPHLKR